jgi:diaminopimelate epimerase
LNFEVFEKYLQISNFMKIHPAGAELFRADERTDRQTDMTWLIVAVRNCAKELKADQLMLYKEIVAICTEFHTKYITTMCGQNVEFFNAKHVYSTYGNHCDPQGWFSTTPLKFKVQGCSSIPSYGRCFPRPGGGNKEVPALVG